MRSIVFIVSFLAAFLIFGVRQSQGQGIFTTGFWQSASGDPFDWTGNGADSNWTTALNWYGGAAPGVNDTAKFGTACAGVKCNATINTAISVKGIALQTGYVGTLTQGTGNSITLGAAGYSQAAGTFLGSNAPITAGAISNANGNFVLSGGAFTSTSGVLTSWYSWVISGGAFNHNNGTIVFEGSNFGASVSTTSVNYNNVTFRGSGTEHNLSGTTLNVLGTLTVGDTYLNSGALVNGTINAKGNVVFDQYGKCFSYWCGGSPTLAININGNSNQTVSGISTAMVPRLVIASTGGTVTLSGYLAFSSDYTWISGALNASASTLDFQGGNLSWNLVFGNFNYNNLSFSGSSGDYNFGGATVNVLGTLTLNNVYSGSGSLNNGTISLKGNLSTTNYGYSGSAWIKINGSTNQTLAGVSTAFIPSLEVISTGGVVSYSGTLKFRGDYKFTSGVLNAGTSNLHFYAFFNTNNVSPGIVNYNNVTFGGDGSAFDLGGGSMSVQGTLYVAREGYWKPSVNTGTVLAYGDISFSGPLNTCSDFYTLGGSHLLKIVGSANQSVISADCAGSNAGFQKIEFAKSGGTLTFGGTGTWAFYNNFTYTSGNVSFGTSTARFEYSSGTPTLSPGSVVFHSVHFLLNGVTVTLGGDIQVPGNFTGEGAGAVGSQGINSNVINVSGHVLFAGNGLVGTTQLNIIGSTSTTLDLGISANSSTVVLNKTGGASVTLSGDSTLRAGQNLNLASGILDLNRNELIVSSTLTVNSGTSLICNGGTFTATTLSNSGSINCPGFSPFAFNWTGATGDGKWSTNGNWSGGVAPTASSTAAFSPAFCSGSNCNATIDTDIDVLGLQMLSGYTGTITQAATKTVTVQTGGWRQYAGTFNGNDGAITINKNFTHTAGTFRSTSGLLTLKSLNAPWAYETFKYSSSGSAIFSNNGGDAALVLSCNAHKFTPGSTIFNNLSIQSNCATVDFGGGSLTVAKNLSFLISYYESNINNGTILVGGNLTADNTNSGYTGNVLLKLTGNSSGQTISGGTTIDVKDRNFPGQIEIAAGANPVTLTGLIATSGYKYTSSGAFTTTGSTLALYNYNATQTLSMGSVTYNNLALRGSYNTIYDFNGGTVNIAGNLTTRAYYEAHRLNNGTLSVGGNLNNESPTWNGSNIGTAVINLVGNAAGRSITGVGIDNQGNSVKDFPNLTFSTGANAVSMSGVVNINGATVVTSGSPNMAGAAFSTASLALNSNTFTKGGGTLTVGGVALGTGALFGGTVAP